jgi:hypothetical protein
MNFDIGNHFGKAAKISGPVSVIFHKRGDPASHRMDTRIESAIFPRRYALRVTAKNTMDIFMPLGQKNPAVLFDF